MRQRIGIIITVLVALGVLVVINSVAYVQQDDREDSELAPNRSTYNARATGTRALYDFLTESGYKVVRWRETTDGLLRSRGQKIHTFVIIGRPRVSITEEDAQSLLLWVKRGGRLVIIDRRPDEYLLPASGKWTVTTELLGYPSLNDDPADPKQMTAGVSPVRAVQPTSLTRSVESIMPSRFFAAIKFFPSSGDSGQGQSSQDQATDDLPTNDEKPFDEPPPPQESTNTVASVSPAPVVHFASAGVTLVLDYPHGEGRIILLSDPFIVSNTGIGLNDNLQLALNLISASGLIAFDEFHQGRAITRNEFASYFSGTPVLPIFGQLVLLVLLLVWTRGRRFARPLPLPAVDRRSSLEFVASMAELQQRAGAFDLAIENVYTRTRRALTRYAGLDYNCSRSQIAERVGERSSVDPHKLQILMRQCEEAINGAKISERQSIQLAAQLREVEGALGLRMRSREVKQTAQNI
ncbi:MAG: DUF4350 domain-containing protein [Pyrinomonadaceae bacterium]